MATPVFLWTEPAIADLKRLYADGLSSSQIAQQLGCPSRNAVIGKVHRLGIQRPVKVAKPAPVKVAKTQRVHPGNIARKAAKRAEERRDHFQAVADKALEKFDAAVPARAERVRFLDRGLFQCAMPQPGWEQAPVAEKMVCGRPVQAGTSWCAACLPVVSPSPKFAAFKHRQMVGGAAA